MTTSSLIIEARYRVRMKRSLRHFGVQVNSDAATGVIERMCGARGIRIATRKEIQRHARAEYKLYMFLRESSDCHNPEGITEKLEGDIVRAAHVLRPRKARRS